MAEGFLGQIRRLRNLAFSNGAQAVGGTTQALATVINQTVTTATGQNGTAAFVIPTIAGSIGSGFYVVINNSASAVPVFPYVGASFNGGAANASVTIAANKTGVFFVGTPSTNIGFISA